MTTRDNFPTKNRCDVCGSAFTTEALLTDHQKLHEANSPAEEKAILEDQGERKS
jgi:hypothetical protein